MWEPKGGEYDTPDALDELVKAALLVVQPGWSPLLLVVTPTTVYTTSACPEHGAEEVACMAEEGLLRPRLIGG